ncbi:MAG: putative toxin-antitoxin system toxin component, PIN family [Burkholderiales bacterium]
MTRVVIDTNVVLSALLFPRGRLAWLRGAWHTGRIVPVVSTDTLAELVRVLGYPKFDLEAQDQKALLTHYMAHAEAVPSPRTRARLPHCRDPYDEIFLRLAYAAKVDALVTGAKDLLELVAESKIPILEPSKLNIMLGNDP